MASITFKGNPAVTVGELPAKGEAAPDFKLVKSDLSEAGLSDFKGKNIILNIFPSLDTGVCAASVRRFNKEASLLKNTVVLCISADLPFAAGRLYGGIENVVTLLTSETKHLVKTRCTHDWGPLKGLLARAVVSEPKESNPRNWFPRLHRADYHSAINSIV